MLLLMVHHLQLQMLRLWTMLLMSLLNNLLHLPLFHLVTLLLHLMTLLPHHMAVLMHFYLLLLRSPRWQKVTIFMVLLCKLLLLRSNLWFGDPCPQAAAGVSVGLRGAMSCCSTGQAGQISGRTDCQWCPVHEGHRAPLCAEIPLESLKLVIEIVLCAPPITDPYKKGIDKEFRLSRYCLEGLQPPLHPLQCKDKWHH